MSEAGRVLILFGIILILLGLLMTVFPKLLFRLPGDIHIEGENYSIYIPIATSILLSVILTLLLNLFLWFINR